MSEFEIQSFFSVADCDYCGECLKACPALGSELRKPGLYFRKLVECANSPEILELCDSCMTCSAVCPNGANPYGLILYRWFERGQKRGYPIRATLVMPLEPDNAWSRLSDEVTEHEKDLLNNWADMSRVEKAERVMFAGCNLRIMPFLASSPIFEEYAIFGDQKLCCGEVYYRIGALRKVKENCCLLEEKLKSIGIKEMACYCQACYNMFKNILQSHFGALFPFKISYFGDALFHDIKRGKISCESILKGLKVTVHDPCHSKLLGKDFQMKPRAILEKLGASVVEMKHHHEFALCCGLGYGAARYNPLDMAKGIIRRLKEARESGAERLVVYCNSCYLLFSIGNLITPWGIPVYHINEIVSGATGFPLPRLAEDRAKQMLRELFIRGMPKVLSPRRIRI